MKRLFIKRFFIFALPIFLIICLFSCQGDKCKNKPLPEIPKGFTALAVSENEIQLNWDEVKGVTSYEICRGGQYLATVEDLIFVDINLSPKTEYSYQIKAKGSCGDSDLSKSVVARTFSVDGWHTIFETDFSALLDIWGTDSDNIYTVGDCSLMLQYNGKTWNPIINGGCYAESLQLKFNDILFVNPMIIPDTKPNDLLSGIWGCNQDNIYIVGSIRFDEIYNIIFINNNGVHEFILSGLDSYLSDIWGSDCNNIFAVGGNGLIYHYDGNYWNKEESPTDELIYFVWGIGNEDVYIIDNVPGRIFHHDGSNWSSIDTGTINKLYGIWGTKNDDLFAVGEKGTILHFDGASWAAQESGVDADLWSIWGFNSNDIYAVGSEGIIIHYNGNNWTAQDSGTDGLLTKVWGLDNKNVYVIAGVVKINGKNYSAILHN
ncbi:MAG: hypothetical protein NT009_03330 [Proteobacteria bacterium]|nr:hypothetical protein [Pseudomonadota bacterium]